jgi:hypothetical protein
MCSKRDAILLEDGISLSNFEANNSPPDSTRFNPMFWYFLLRLIWKNSSAQLCALIIFIFCTMIEFSQLFVTPLLQTLRQNFFGAVLLGSGFEWLDIAYYAVGVGLAVGIEVATKKQEIKKLRN